MAARIRSEASLDQFFVWLGPRKSARIRLGVMDMWRAVRNSTTRYAPNAKCALAFEQYEAWYDVLFDTEEAVETAAADAPDDYADEDDMEANELARWPRKRQGEVARQLAAHPKFALCKTIGSRVYLLQEILGETEEIEQWTAKDIAREAVAIFDLEVRPKARR